MKPSLSIAIALTILLCGGVVPALQAQPVTGAIFTTLSNGTAVNANHFDSKCAVYLDGGPGPNAPAKAAGLPNGDYYFQVTDPSGKVLLSTDPVSNRRFQVAGGFIVAYTGTGDVPHPVGVDSDHGDAGAITIRLANTTCGEKDFLDSPNNGGTYKVWATPVADFVGSPANVDNPCGNGCFHGFIPSKSKTDNFKARTGTPTFCLTMVKEFLGADGTVQPSTGWPMNVTDPLNVTNTYFVGDADVVSGAYEVKVCGLVAGAYRVEEDSTFVTGASLAALIVNGADIAPALPYYHLEWKAGDIEPRILFRNILDGGGVPQ